MAAERLGLNNKAASYWDIHIKEDIRHGQWMLNDVALPLIDMYKDNAWEISNFLETLTGIKTLSTSLKFSLFSNVSLIV